MTPVVAVIIAAIVTTIAVAVITGGYVLSGWLHDRRLDRFDDALCARSRSAA